jgi:hypothetical protein
MLITDVRSDALLGLAHLALLVGSKFERKGGRMLNCSTFSTNWSFWNVSAACQVNFGGPPGLLCQFGGPPGSIPRPVSKTISARSNGRESTQSATGGPKRNQSVLANQSLYL